VRHASGALRGGSVPEVLEDGVTGFICETEDELVQAIGRIGELDAPAAVGGRAEVLAESDD